MDNSHNKEEARKIGAFQFFTLILSVYVLLALLVESIFKLPPDVADILRYADTAICFVFLSDFCIRFYQANNKAQFMKWGWVDLLSSIPMVDAFRYGRIVRVVRVLRIMRAVRSTKLIISYLFRKRMQGTFSLVSAVSILLVIFGAIAILQLEKGVEGSNIQYAGDAVWWAFVTITTVGYGDYYPITYEGRIIAGILMTAGVGLFGTFTGFVASWFLEEDEDKQDNHAVTNLRNEVLDLKDEIRELKELLKQSR
ncbi:potassium channel family protein [Photobacterium rosenbergii]|uniref:potassium channel family protein n=1 Tax=Photobacterium rosenbergii TaxID=294936 RepID=UPI001C996D06|nr:potassium channel family protein [Photobacterium rosenbergii]MBY5945992.1 potassium channel family protein [Photobacterium rosenbergii]